MKTMKPWIRIKLLALVLALTPALWPALRAEHPDFNGKPRFYVEGDEATVEFAVNRETDVAVAIEDADGAVIRHLAAGVLGENAPPPLQPRSLRQTLRWDRLDDQGRPAANGPFRVRVSLGLAPAFDRMLGNHPAHISRIRGLACGPDGTLYVLHCFGAHHSRDNSAAIAVFNREGRYLRTIAPFPAELTDEKLEGIRTLRLDDGKRVPYVYQYDTRSYLPGLGDLPKQRMVATRDGRLAFVGIQEGPKNYAQPGETRLTVIETDGGIPREGPLQTLIHPLTDSGASLALSPDEQTVYATGVRVGMHPAIPANRFTCQTCDHGGRTWLHSLPVPMVFGFAWGDEQVSVFVDGTRREDGRPLLVEPLEVALGPDGRVFVADFGADQIRIFDARGERIGDIPITQPFRVSVHRETGAIYALSGHTDIDLVKFSSDPEPREMARTRLREYRRMTPILRPILALDDSASPPVLWVDYQRVEDLGDTFGDPVSITDLNPPEERPMASVMELSVDRTRRHLYVNNRRRLNLETDTWESIDTEGGRMWPESHPNSASGTAGRDGMYYVNLGARRARVIRYDPEMNPVPFSITRDDEGRLPGFARNRGRGQTADHLGNVYVLWKKEGELADEGDYHRAHALAKYAPDGTALNEKLINAQIPSISSPRVDFQGNIYVVAGLRPGTHTVPAELRGQVPETLRDADAVHALNSYPMIYGSIVKFGPEGGSIFTNAGGRQANYAYGRPIEVSGAHWIHSGVSVASSWSTPKIGRVRSDGQWGESLQAPGTTIVCLCEHANIDVDGFGRVFYPDAGRARVGMLDAAGNLMGVFGSYGNPDSTGLSFWWPQAVAVDKTAVYVGDRLNRRIVVARLAYQKETTLELE